MKRFALALVLAACGSKSHDAGVGSAASGSAAPASGSGANAATGYLLWRKPAPELDSGDGPPIPQLASDHWMLMDVGKKVSEDLGEAPISRVNAINASGEAIYIASGLQVVRVRGNRGKAIIEPIGDVRSPDAFAAVAPDGSTAVRFDSAALCIARPGDKDCTTEIKLAAPDMTFWETAYYTGSTRVVVTAADGKQDANAVGMGMHPIVRLVDIAAKTATALDVPAVGGTVYPSPDGRIAWNEAANGTLLLAVAPVDNIAAKKTYELGPAEAQAEAMCAWGADRVVCVVRNRGALISIDTKNGTTTTLVAENAIWVDFVVSRDGRWIVFQTQDGQLGNIKWHVSPTDKAGAMQDLPIGERDKPLAWL